MIYSFLIWCMSLFIFYQSNSFKLKKKEKEKEKEQDVMKSKKKNSNVFDIKNKETLYIYIPLNRGTN